MFKSILIGLLSLSFTCALAQVKPMEGATINYRLIGFTIPGDTNVATYKLEVANGIINNNTDFNKRVILTQRYNKNKMIATLPQFGKSYTWRVTYANKKRKTVYTPLYHFSIGTTEDVDTSMYRLHIVQAADHHKNLLAFLDYSKALYDMDGNVLWYMPQIKGMTDHNIRIRDLRPTSSGTITFLTSSKIYEIDYDGNIIWQSAETITPGDINAFERFHHEFIKLSNGNYMVAGNHFYNLDIETNNQSTEMVNNNANVSLVKGKVYRRVPMATIEEYDSKGTKVWEWSSSSFMKDDTLFLKKIYLNPDDLGPRMNSFYFDEKNKFVYMSFKNAHHIVKIAYPSGKVLAKYNGTITEPPMFRGQHAVRLNNAGNIILFNNNNGSFSGRQAIPPSYLVELQEDNDTLKKVWEFSCNIDSYTQSNTASGGNVIELNDGCYISCAGTTGRNFIVTKNKQIVWNAVMQQKIKDNQWQPYEEYKISVIETGKQLEDLIFNTTKPATK
jgi:hypothetical protein